MHTPPTRTCTRDTAHGPAAVLTLLFGEGGLHAPCWVQVGGVLSVFKG